MELMYVKYINGERHSIIKNGDDIIMSNSKIIKFDSAKKQKTNEHTPCLKKKNNQVHNSSNDKINEEITDFFFNAIHKNYLSNRNK
ncbi:hypothetical protein ACUH7Y_12615 [Clostridium beijerinckii]|uniref:Uncharacterized protein n=1 Tax=Clostridium beijerinckii TaxID=1520 RepID=A0A7X9XQD2_CLOBE|nr:hypothetical protein [Clostridium beijerinckii]NMF06349.1 hypothetical protein [Clostridium beijerinckii]